MIMLLLTVYPLTAFGHSLYIQSGRYTVPKGKSSPVFFCFGHHFPIDEGVRAKKLHAIKVIAPDGTTEEIEILDTRSLHSYEVKYEQTGTYTLTAETNPGFYAIYTDKKGKVHHSLKPKHAWIDTAEKIISSMRSSQWTKTYVNCDSPSKAFPANIGLPLELVPVAPIAGLKDGDTLELHVYMNGKPYTGEGFWDASYGGFSTEAEDTFIPRTKIIGGKITVPLKHSGRWFVRYFTKTEAAQENQNDYLTEKRTTTITFLVRNERIRPRPAKY